MTVTTNTLFTSAWDTVYTYLQTTNPISTNNIHSAMNDKLIRTEGYPQVIIEVPRPSYDPYNLPRDMVFSEVNISIRIYHLSSESLKSLADNVITKLRAGQTTFSGAGLKRMSITTEEVDSWQEENKKVHYIQLNVEFHFGETS